jgi:hypothetical protein
MSFSVLMGKCFGYCPRINRPTFMANDNINCISYRFQLMVMLGLAIAQAVSHWLPTAAPRIQSQVKSCGICGRQSGAGAGFLRVLWFPLTILIPPTAPHSSSAIIRGWYNRPISGQHTKRTQSHLTPRNKKIVMLVYY